MNKAMEVLDQKDISYNELGVHLVFHDKFGPATEEEVSEILRGEDILDWVIGEWKGDIYLKSEEEIKNKFNTIYDQNDYEDVSKDVFEDENIKQTISKKDSSSSSNDSLNSIDNPSSSGDNDNTGDDDNTGEDGNDDNDNSGDNVILENSSSNVTTI